jgi:hypothetical protein
MDWITALSAAQSGRSGDRKKLENNTYVEILRNAYRANVADHERGVDYEKGTYAVGILLHNTYVVTFYPDGSFRVATGEYHTKTTHDRINSYLPAGWRVGGRIDNRRNNLEPYTALYHHGELVCYAEPSCTINADGTPHPDSIVDTAEMTERLRDEEREHRRVRAAFARWRRRARTHEVPKRMTAETIRREPNADLRALMLAAYGTVRYFEETGGEVIDSHGEYELYRSTIGDGWLATELITLKMVCPSTGLVHLNTIDPHRPKTVAAALDWMYGVTDYLGMVGQQA